MSDKLNYIPPATTTIKIDLTFPWLGKEWKVRQVSLKDYQDHILGAAKMIKPPMHSA